MDAAALLAHIVSQTRHNIDFLIAQKQISEADGRDILQKLPAANANPSAVVSARAIWGYNEQGHDPSDLSFRAGDVITIVAETNADWWTGTLNGRHGIFPSNYVQKLPPTPYGPGSEKAQFPPYQPTGGYQGPPPPAQPVYTPYGQPHPQQPPAQQPPPPQDPKKGKFGGKLGSTLAHSAVGGVGFGAGSAVGSGIINSIF